jgi:hypothetical protein
MTGYTLRGIRRLPSGRTHRYLPAPPATSRAGQTGVGAGAQRGSATTTDATVLIGMIFAFVIFLVAIGVVVVLGAVAGLAWQERSLSSAAALKKMRRA